MAARAASPTPGTAVVNLAAWRTWLADELASAAAANEAAATAAVSEVLSTLDASRESLALIRNPGGGDAVELQLLGEPRPPRRQVDDGGAGCGRGGAGGHQKS